MQRYSPEMECHQEPPTYEASDWSAGMIKDQLGDYVKLEDANAEIERLRGIIEGDE